MALFTDRHAVFIDALYAFFCFYLCVFSISGIDGRIEWGIKDFAAGLFVGLGREFAISVNRLDL